MITLGLVEGSKPETVLQLLGKRISLGRAPDNVVHVGSLNASRYHAEILAQDEGYVLRDMNSTGGSFVRRGEEKMEVRGDSEPLTLEVGDEISLGTADCVLRVKSIGKDIMDAGFHGKTLVAADPGDMIKTVSSSDLPQIRKRVYENRLLLQQIAECDRRIDSAVSADSVLQGLVQEMAAFYPQCLYTAAIRVAADRNECVFSLAGRGQTNSEGYTVRLSRTLGDLAATSSGILYRVEQGSTLVSGDGIRRNLTVPLPAAAEISGVCGPIVVRGRTQYFLQLESNREESKFSEEDLDFVMIISNRAASRIENLQAMEQIAQQQQLAMIGVVAKCIAHDLGNVIHRIVGPAGMIRSGLWKEMPDDRKQRLFSSLVYGAQLARARCEDFMGISETPQSRPLDLGELVRNVTEECTNVFGGEVEISVYSGESIPAIQGDPAKVKRILWNLVDNAVKAARNREGFNLHVDIELRVEKGTVIFRVRDNIPGGMPQEDLDRFVELRNQIASIEPGDTELLRLLLARMDDASVRGKQGHGIGSFFLCMAVQELGGKIDLSTGAEGTCFSLTFPVG